MKKQVCWKRLGGAVSLTLWPICSLDCVFSLASSFCHALKTVWLENWLGLSIHRTFCFYFHLCWLMPLSLVYSIFILLCLLISQLCKALYLLHWNQPNCWVRAILQTTLKSLSEKAFVNEEVLLSFNTLPLFYLMICVCVFVQVSRSFQHYANQ